MGEVYRARDTRLGRDVALKVLPAGLADDALRQRRFEQEARAMAALNHPNVATVYDVGAEGSISYLVTEVVDGESLRAIVDRGPLPVRTAIDIAGQVAEGLAAAHAAGIVHRDLKPGNIMVTRQGRAKVLDFGLAKQVIAPEAAASATVSLSPTEPGMVIGTFGYMSPEQVRGQAADERSDIFAFGVVLHEMLSGKCAFSRDSAADVISAILKEDPPELSPSIPPALERVVRRCLNKNAEVRFQSALDLAFAIENISPGSSADRAPSVSPKNVSRATRSKLWIAALVAAAAGLGVVAGRLLWKEPHPEFRQLTYRHGTISGAAFAPDGRTVVYSASWDNKPPEIFSSSVEFPEARPLGLSGARLFGVSTKGELAIALEVHYRFHTTYAGTLARVPLSGGAPRMVLKDVQEAAWAPDGESLAVVHLVVGQSLIEYPIGKVLYRTSGWITNLAFSPRGGLLAFLDHPVLGDNLGSVAVVALDGKKTTLSTGWESERGLAWTAKGDEVFFVAALAGQPKTIFGVTLAGKLRTVSSMPAGLAIWDIRPGGRVLLENQNRRSEMIGVGADGVERDLAYLDNPRPAFLSPDGRTLLFTEMGEAAGNTYSVCIRGSDGSAALRLGPGAALALSPDGKWALGALFTAPQRLVLLPVEEGETRSLPQAGLEYEFSAAWHPDSRHVLFTAHRPGQLSQVWVQNLEGDSPKPLTPPGTVMNGEAISPDGLHLAATAPDGRLLVYTLNHQMEAGEARYIPGASPAERSIGWATGGRAIYVYQPEGLPVRIYRIDVTTGKRELVREFMPSNPVGVYSMRVLLLSADGRTAVYGFQRITSELFLADGLK
jgi:serine/threonine protein kinase